MKSALLFASIAAILFLTSCQKEIEGTIIATDSTTTGSLVRGYNETIVSTNVGNSNTSYNLTYDASNRLVSLASTPGAAFKFLYQYNADNTIYFDEYDSGKLGIHEVFYFNSLALLDSTFQYNDTKDTTIEKYYYNSKRQLVTLKEFDYKTATGTVLLDADYFTYDATGNMISDIDTNKVATYSYTGNIANTLNMGTGYLQTSTAPYLPTSVTVSESGISITGTHTYTFDARKRLSIDKQVLTSGDVATKTYTY